MFSAANRLLQLSSSAFEPDTFLPYSFQGSEGLSQPFEFIVDVISQNAELNYARLVGANVTLTISMLTGTRVFNALIAGISQQDVQFGFNVTHYQLTLQPWLSTLDLSRDCRRFENQTAIDIITTICREAGYSSYLDIKLSNLANLKSLDYTVQYNETAFDFISRLLADNQLYYYFRYQEKQHRLVITDELSSWLEPNQVPFSATAIDTPHVDAWLSTAQGQSAVVAFDDYNFKTPRTSLEQEYQVVSPFTALNKKRMSHYSFQPGRLGDKVTAQAAAKRRAQQIATDVQKIYGSSNMLSFAPGYVFRLADYSQADTNPKVCLTRVTHEAHDHGYMPQDIDIDADTPRYRNTFEALPYSAAFYPSVTAPAAPKINAQTAVLAGLKSDTHSADKLRQVKAQFYWQHGNDTALTTHQARVLQPIAGQNWGAQFLPRVGDEVLIRYLDGDPNQPVIIGSVHNAARKPYMTLPTDAAQSGLTTRTLGSHDPTQSHGLHFDDTAQHEKLSLSSSCDTVVSAVSDKTVTAANDITHHVGGDHTLDVQTVYLAQAAEGITLNAGDQTLQILPDSIHVLSQNILLGGTSSVKAPPLTPPVAAPNLNEVYYWLKLSYPAPIDKLIPATETFDFESQPTTSKDDPKYFTGDTTKYAIGTTAVPLDATVTTVNLSLHEIIALDDKPLASPVGRTTLQAANIKAASSVKLTPYEAAGNDKAVNAEVLFPPIMLNLRNDCKTPKYFLTEDELQYFKLMGNNVMIFIHGFEVPLGAYPQQLRTLETAPYEEDSLKLILPEVTPLYSWKPSYSRGLRSTYCDTAILQQQFPAVASQLANSEQAPLPTELQANADNDVDNLNGTDACNWFLRVEDNLNAATGQFDRSDYRKYTRCLHVAWQGDVGLSDYLHSEDRADSAGLKLPEALLQLHNAGITINVIAHSMGNRVLLKALDALADPEGQYKKSNVVDHVFLWDAAVAATALSSDAQADTSYRQNHKFIHAANAVNKITALYNNDDDTLLLPYWVATYTGYDMTDVIAKFVSWTPAAAHYYSFKNTISFTEYLLQVTQSQLPTLNVWEHLFQHFTGRSLSEPRRGNSDSRFADLLTDMDFLPALCWYFLILRARSDDNALDARYPSNYSALLAQAKKNQRKIIEHKIFPPMQICFQRYGCDPALGLVKPNIEIQNQLRSKLFMADMTAYDIGHSYMHRPNAAVMQYGYKGWIINTKNGTSKFGVYDSSQFDRE